MAEIERYVKMGFTHLVFHAPGPDQRRFMDLYAERILPKLRRLSAVRGAGRTAAQGAGQGARG